MYEDFYGEYLGIENNVKQAASTAASHSVSNNICSDLQTIINDLSNLSSSLQSGETDDAVTSFSSCIATNISTIESINSFLLGDYVNVETVYQTLKTDLDVLKELDEKLKTTCDNEPKQSDYKKEKKETSYNSAGEKVEKTVMVDDTAKFNEAHDAWKKEVEDIKTNCRAVKSIIDESLNYLSSINGCVPANGPSGIKVSASSLSTISLDPNAFNTFNGSDTDSSSAIPSGTDDLSAVDNPKITDSEGHFVDGASTILSGTDDLSVVNDPNSPASSKDIVYEKTRFADTDVWYAIIPKSLQPQLAVSNDSNGKVSSVAPSALASEVGAKLAINFSLTGKGYTEDSRKSYMGGGAGLIYDGQNLYKLKNNYHDTTLYMDQSGNLGYFYNNPQQNGGKTPEQKLEEVNPQWAAKTFYPIAVDGQYVDENKDPNIGGNSVNPRTFIGQTKSGDYFVGVCTGRNSDGKQKGMTLKEVYDFAQQATGGNINFLMNGDGGGSSSFVYEGKKLNPNTDKTERARPDIIYWKA